MPQSKFLELEFAVAKQCLKAVFRTKCPQMEYLVADIVQLFQSKDVTQVLHKNNHDVTFNFTASQDPFHICRAETCFYKHEHAKGF